KSITESMKLKKSQIFYKYQNSKLIETCQINLIRNSFNKKKDPKETVKSVQNVQRKKNQEKQLKQRFSFPGRHAIIRGLVISQYNIGYNFVTTLDYVFLRTILRKEHCITEYQISWILILILLSLCLGAVIGGGINDGLKNWKFQRKKGILYGIVLGGLVITAIPLIQKITQNSSFVLIIMSILLCFSHFLIGTSYGPWFALFKEVFTSKERRGISFIIIGMGAFGALFAQLIFSWILEIDYSALIWVITGSSLIFTGILSTLFFTQTREKSNESNVKENLKELPKALYKLGGVLWGNILIVTLIWGISTHLIECGFIDALTLRFTITFHTATKVYLLMGACSIVTLPFCLFLLNKMNVKVSILITSVIYACFCGGLAFITNFSLIYFLSFLGGIGNLLISSLQITLPLDTIPRGKEASFCGIFLAISSISKPLALVIQGWFLDNSSNISITPRISDSYEIIFAIAGIITLFSIMTVLPFKIEEIQKDLAKI
ncbi:MAG: MFS transporter, partial [Asgard group archaeon]|nr:MFS transporter [Asgard group archaeon]